MEVLPSDGDAKRWTFFLIGFGSCLVAIWIHKVFTNWIFGKGLLSGQSKTPAAGHYVHLSRGNVHYVFLERSQDVTTESTVDTTVSTCDTVSTDPESDQLNQPFLATVNNRNGPVVGKKLEYGCIDGDLVIIVHGFAGSNDAFVSDQRSGYASWLARNGYSVLVFDLYGFGHSDGPDTTYSSELFVEQLAELCLVFGISKPFDLIGFSMGGSVALQFAYRYEHLVKRLILQAPHVVESPLRFSLQIALRIPFFREILSYFIIPKIGECGNNRAALRASFRLLLSRLKGGGRWSSPGRGGSTKEMLAEVDKSGRVIFLLWGRKDSVVNCAQSHKFCKLAPNTKLTTHPTADHMCFADGPHDTREFFKFAILEILAENHHIV